MKFPNPIAPGFDPGSVWLAGAGPGDPGLLTSHAARALQTADVILHDALIPADVPSPAPRERQQTSPMTAGAGTHSQKARARA